MIYGEMTTTDNILYIKKEDGTFTPLSAMAYVIYDDSFVSVRDIDAQEISLFKMSDAYLFESIGNYTRVFLLGGRRILFASSLDQLEEKIKSCTFFRASRKYLFNIRHLQKIEPNYTKGYYITLPLCKVIEMSRRQTIDFQKLIGIGR